MDKSKLILIPGPPSPSRSLSEPALAAWNATLSNHRPSGGSAL